MFRSLFKPDPDRLLTKRDVGGLLKAVQYKQDPTVRAKAAAALGALGGPEAIDALIEALADEAPEVRASAAGGLSETGDAKAVEALIKALGDEAGEVRALAARDLNRGRGAKAAEALADYKREHCMRCGTRIQSYEPSQMWTGQPGLMPWQAVERIGAVMTTRRANCECGAVLCMGCTPTGGGDLPVCEFCGAELNWRVSG